MYIPPVSEQLTIMCGDLSTVSPRSAINISVTVSLDVPLRAIHSVVKIGGM